MLFRVHFADGDKLDIDAKTPAEAAASAKTARNGVITKIKLVKEAA